GVDVVQHTATGTARDLPLSGLPDNELVSMDHTGRLQFPARTSPTTRVKALRELHVPDLLDTELASQLIEAGDDATVDDRRDDELHRLLGDGLHAVPRLTDSVLASPERLRQSRLHRTRQRIERVLLDPLPHGADLALDPVPDRGDGALQSIEPCLQVVPNVPNDRRENRLHVLVPDRADLRLDRVPDRVDRGLQEIESRLKLTLDEADNRLEHVRLDERPNRIDRLLDRIPDRLDHRVPEPRERLRQCSTNERHDRLEDDLHSRPPNLDDAS